MKRSIESVLRPTKEATYSSGSYNLLYVAPVCTQRTTRDLQIGISVVVGVRTGFVEVTWVRVSLSTRARRKTAYLQNARALESENRTEAGI